MKASMAISETSSTSIFDVNDEDDVDIFRIINSNSTTHITDTEAMVFAVVNTLLGLAIIIGNCVVIAVVAKIRTLQSCAGVVVLNVAVTDVVTGVTLVLVSPPSISSVYPYSHGVMAAVLFVCRTISYNSVFSVAFVALDRWVAITRPDLYTSLVAKKTIRRLVAGFWCLAGLMSGLGFLSPKCYIASERFSLELLFILCTPLFIYIYSCVHLLHFLTTLFCCTQIFRHLQKRVIDAAYSQSESLPYFKQQVNFAKILFIILLVFVLNTYPYLFYTLILKGDAAGRLFSLVGMTMMYSNSLLRVIVYMVLVISIRKALLPLLYTEISSVELFVVSPS